MAGSANNVGIPIDKLKGMEDYNNWKFMMRMLLLHEDMYECVESESGCKDDKKNKKALAKICLSVSSSALNHVRNAETPYQAWTNLQKAYEDKGLSRRLGLLRSLFGVKLKEVGGMESYISRITELAQQLKDIDSPLDDEFIAIIMLSGLTCDYDPLIMALENTSGKLSSETVKAKLLQENQRRDDKSEHSEVTALVARKVYKCFKCKKPGHFKKDCPKNTSGKTSQASSGSYCKDKALLTALSVKVQDNSWYIDSGATNHMCNNSELMSELVMDNPREINVANGDKLFTKGCGNIKIGLKNSIVRTISNVFFVPNLTTNLLSVSELARKGYTVTFDLKCCKIYDGSEV